MELHKVTKKEFKQWHSDGALMLWTAGISTREKIFSALSDYNHDYLSESKPVARQSSEGGDNAVYMVSNGVTEFILVIDSSDVYEEGREHFTIYTIKGTK